LLLKIRAAFYQKNEGKEREFSRNLVKSNPNFAALRKKEKYENIKI